MEGTYHERGRDWVHNELLLALVDAVESHRKELGRMASAQERVAETFDALARQD